MVPKCSNALSLSSWGSCVPLRYWNDQDIIDKMVLTQRQKLRLRVRHALNVVDGLCHSPIHDIHTKNDDDDYDDGYDPYDENIGPDSSFPPPMSPPRTPVGRKTWVPGSNGFYESPSPQGMLQSTCSLYKNGNTQRDVIFASQTESASDTCRTHTDVDPATPHVPTSKVTPQAPTKKRKRSSTPSWEMLERESDDGDDDVIRSCDKPDDNDVIRSIQARRLNVDSCCLTT